MKRVRDGITESLRLDDVAKGKAEGRGQCIGCDWSVDDAELDLCCDCFDEIAFRQVLRGDYGKDEQREAQETAHPRAL